MRYLLIALLTTAHLLAQGVGSEHDLRLFDQANPASSITIRAQSGLGTSYSLTLPPAQGAAGTVLSSNGSGVLTWSPSAMATSLSSLTNAVGTNTITSGAFAQTWTWNSLAGTTALTVSDSRTGPSTEMPSAMALYGNASNSTGTTRELFVENAHTGTSATNIGVIASASGGMQNIALLTINGSTGFLLGTDVMPNANVHIGAGTSTLAPLKFTSGTNLSIAEKSAVEYDGEVFYTSTDTLARGVLPSKYFVILDADNTMTSQTTAQPIFDGGGGSATGAVDVPTGLYEFEMLIHLTGISATSGTVEFSFDGTSTRNSFIWKSSGGRYADVAAPNVLIGRFYSSRQAFAITLSNASTVTTGWYYITGMMRISAAGTVIPSLRTSVAAAAVVKQNSYFKLNKLGTNTASNVGRWK